MVSKRPKRVQVESNCLGWRGRVKVYLGLIALVVIVYSPSLHAGYHADDWSHSYIPRGFSGIGDLWSPPFPFSASLRPVFVAHLWGLSQLSEASIPLARLWVILLHGMSSIVVFEIGLLLFKGREVWIPLISAGWFAVAFCHFEVPTALTNSETPAALLLLSTGYVLARYWPLKRPREQVLFIILWLLALGSKEYALWIPMAWFAMHLFSKSQARMSLSDWLIVLVPLVAVSSLYLIHYVSIDRDIEDLALVREPSLSAEGLMNLLSSIASLPLLDPAHSRWEGVFHTYLDILFPLLAAARILLFLTVLAVGVFLWRSGSRAPVVVGFALILGPLLLACWLPGPAASRHTYLPGAGFGLLLAAFCAEIKSEKKHLVWIALTVALCLNGAGSMGVGWKLTQVTRERERITERLKEDLEGIGLENRVILAGLDPQLRVGMSAPFLFPERKLETLEPSPLLEDQPIERLREYPPSDEEAVVLEWDGSGFRQIGISKYLGPSGGGATLAPG